MPLNIKYKNPRKITSQYALGVGKNGKLYAKASSGDGAENAEGIVWIQPNTAGDLPGDMEGFDQPEENQANGTTFQLRPAVPYPYLFVAKVKGFLAPKALIVWSASWEGAIHSFTDMPMHMEGRDFVWENGAEDEPRQQPPGVHYRLIGTSTSDDETGSITCSNVQPPQLSAFGRYAYVHFRHFEFLQQEPGAGYYEMFTNDVPPNATFGSRSIIGDGRRSTGVPEGVEFDLPDGLPIFSRLVPLGAPGTPTTHKTSYFEALQEPGVLTLTAKVYSEAGGDLERTEIAQLTLVDSDGASPGWANASSGTGCRPNDCDLDDPDEPPPPPEENCIGPVYEFCWTCFPDHDNLSPTYIPDFIHNECVVDGELENFEGDSGGEGPGHNRHIGDIVQFREECRWHTTSYIRDDLTRQIAYFTFFDPDHVVELLLSFEYPVTNDNTFMILEGTDAGAITYPGNVELPVYAAFRYQIDTDFGCIFQAACFGISYDIDECEDEWPIP